MRDPWQPVFDPEWALGVTVIAVDYALVCIALRRGGQPVSRWRMAAFGAGLLLTGLALFSPIEHLALTSMLSFHLLQNVMLGDWAPPLLLLGLSAPMFAALERRRWLRAIVEPRVAVGFWLATWYVTHLPAVYDYALRHPAALGVEHLAFLLSGLAFWWPEIAPGHLSSLGKVAYLAIAFVAISPLDMGIYLWTEPLYGFYLDTPKLGGISTLADQQIAGAAMAVETYTVLGIAMCLNLLGELRREAPGPDTATAMAIPVEPTDLPTGESRT